MILPNNGWSFNPQPEKNVAKIFFIYYLLQNFWGITVIELHLTGFCFYRFKASFFEKLSKTTHRITITINKQII